MSNVTNSENRVETRGNSNTMSEIIHTNSKGINIVRIDAKKRSRVVVYGRDNYIIRTYMMNNIPFYNHQYLSWDNLDCCGGWSYDEEYLYTAVQNDKKLIAQISFIIESPDEDPRPAMKKFQELVPYFDETKINALIEMGHICGPNNQARVWHVILIRKGCLADYFDLSEIKDAYAKHDIIIDGELKKALSELFQVELEDLYLENSDYFYNIQSILDCIMTGLCFGYPIESTVAIIHG